MNERNITSSIVGLAARRIRTAKGLTIAEVAARTQEEPNPIGASTLSRLETGSGSRLATIDVLQSLANALEVSLSDLLYDPVAVTESYLTAQLDEWATLLEIAERQTDAKSKDTFAHIRWEMEQEIRATANDQLDWDQISDFADRYSAHLDADRAQGVRVALGLDEAEV